MTDTTTTDPNRLRAIAANVRADAADADEGTEDSGLVADLLDAAASEDFQEFSDVRLVLECIGRIADRMETALTQEGPIQPVKEEGNG